jgi:pimeloyl-ACP methyl ester carboxylesterase
MIPRHFKTFAFGSFSALVFFVPMILGLNEEVARASCCNASRFFQQTPETTEQNHKPDGTTKGIIDFERPADAIQLVGDSGSVMVPESSAKCEWTFQDGVLTASPHWDSVVSPDAYQDFRLHLEFKLNDPGEVPRERSGNSGVYLQQRYELQILNSHGISVEDFGTDDCASIYGIKKPDQFVCKPPGEWQTFDIAFRAARFEGSQKTENARVSVFHNGELIHDDFELPRKTGAGKPEENSLRPIKLQGHHNQVQFRNIWVQKLNLGTAPSSTSIPSITVSYKTLPMPGEVFKLNGSDAFVLMPKALGDSSTKIPWVWYAPTLQPFPAQEEIWMFERFLAAGIAVAGIDVGESYGSPSGREKFDAFYHYLVTSRNFASKPALLARSRGGLMHYSWAAANPELVSCIAGIYPVCNLASYPGINRACEAYGLNAEQLQADLAKFNPIDRLETIAAAKVPIFHIHGDQDEVVPLDANSLLVANRYRAFMGEIELEIVEGQGHNMWDGWFQSKRLVEFILENISNSVR